MSGQNGTIYFTLASKEILTGDAFCPGGSRGAYFDLTLSNGIIRNVMANKNLDSNEYTLTDYSLDDFSPSGPVEPLNNYRSCGGVIVDVRIVNINDPQIYYYGKLKLIVTRPKPIYYYRQVAGGSGDYFYTKNYNTIGNGSIAGMSYIGVAFNANYNNVQGTIPVYRYFNSQYVDHFYTKTYMANGTAGYTSEGIEFYAYNYQAPGTIPVYRYYSPSLQNHFYTTNFSSYGNGGSGYSYEGIEFYAFPANANVSKNDNDSNIKDNPVNVKTETDSINISNFTVFPNPTTGIINIKNDSKTIDSVIVNNLFGEEVQTNKTSNSNTELDISNLPKGIYLVKVKSGDEEKVMRVIKE